MSKAIERDVRRLIQSSPVRSYGLMPIGIGRMPEERAGLAMVGDWANATGGYALAWTADGGVQAPEVPASILRRIHHDLSQYYQLVIEFPMAVDKPQSWKLEAYDQRGKKMGRWNLFYPQMVPCPGTVAGAQKR